MQSELERAIMDCFSEIQRNTIRDIGAILSQTPAEQLSLHHFGLGLYLRNNVLKPESELYKLFIHSGITHKDDMSSEMIRLWHEAISGDTARNIDSAERWLPLNSIWRVIKMESLGIVRAIDELGRVVLPAEARGKLDLREKDTLEVFIDDGGIYLKPYDAKHCAFCSGRDKLIPHSGRYICESCLADINGRVVDE